MKCLQFPSSIDPYVYAEEMFTRMAEAWLENIVASPKWNRDIPFGLFRNGNSRQLRQLRVPPLINNAFLGVLEIVRRKIYDLFALHPEQGTTVRRTILAGDIGVNV